MVLIVSRLGFRSPPQVLGFLSVVRRLEYTLDPMLGVDGQHACRQVNPALLFWHVCEITRVHTETHSPVRELGIEQNGVGYSSNLGRARSY